MVGHVAAVGGGGHPMSRDILGCSEYACTESLEERQLCATVSSRGLRGTEHVIGVGDGLPRSGRLPRERLREEVRTGQSRTRRSV